MGFLTSSDGSFLTSSDGSYLVTSDASLLTLTAPTAMGAVGTAYSSSIGVSGGSAPLAFSIILGSLPTSISLNAVTGTLTGTPTVAGTYTFTILVTDSGLGTNIGEFTILITSATVSGSGIYKLVPGKTHDTLYTVIPTTQDVAIPNPFIETALLNDGSDENILHFGAYRIRVNGSGVLRATLKGLDGTTSIVLPTLTMSATPGKEPTLLTNFVSQRALLRLETTAIDEKFDVNRIIVYIRGIYQSFPQ